jgi:hypothetical protein
MERHDTTATSPMQHGGREEIANVPPSNRPWRLRTLWVAATINAIAWIVMCVLLTWDSNPFAATIAVLGTAVAIGVTTLGVIIVHLVFGRRDFRPIWRYCSYALPSAAFVLAVLFISRHDRPNQKQNLVSPSGEYVLSLPIEGQRWRVTIRNRKGRIEYVDTSSDFNGALNVYWAWDDQDSVWLYNSDDGQVWCWIKDGRTWKKHTRYEVDGSPPPSLAPKRES